jgi:NAD(P)-dependent dehydrogenase (short-subunit alcohol dehydrogenase family)
MMVKQGRGLVVFTSAPGAVHYCFGPAYGAHKAGVDKMAADMAVDFNDAGVDVASVSIWMGSLTTERLLQMMAAEPEKFKHLEGTLETPELTGHVTWALYNDPDLMKVSGRTLIGAELAKQYGITDIGGIYPPSVRDMHHCEPREQYPYKIK